MKGLVYYGTNASIQGSFYYLSHENLAVTSTASTSAAITTTKSIVLTLTVPAHIKIGSGSATTSDFVMPAGVWPMPVAKGDTVSVIQLTGGTTGQASVIHVEEK